MDVLLLWQRTAARFPGFFTPIWRFSYWITGCGASLLHTEKLDHEETCEYRPYSCPCPGASCKWQGSLEQARKSWKHSGIAWSRHSIFFGILKTKKINCQICAYSLKKIDLTQPSDSINSNKSCTVKTLLQIWTWVSIFSRPVDSKSTEIQVVNLNPKKN